MAVPAILAFLLPLVVLLGILAVAIYEHVASVALSLPIAPQLTAVTIALPLVAVANAVYLHLGRRVADRHRRRHHPQQQYSRAVVAADQPPDDPKRLLLWTAVSFGRFRLPGLPAVLQVLQGVVTVATAAILIVNNIAGGGGDAASSSPLLRCALESTWQQLYSAHDAAGLRRIQDALNCCGFNSVVDRAWPFPRGSPGGGGSGATCAESYGRTEACRAPWTQAAQRRAGVELAVVGLVAVFQALTLVVRAWPPAAEVSLGRPHAGAAGAQRPLLEDGQRPAAPYADDDEEEEEEEETNNTGSTNGATGAGNGPRLEPSGLHNAWAAE